MADRTWVVTASKNIVAEGVEIAVGDRVAAITSSVPPQTLFGLMQYHGFTIDEIPVDSSRIDDAVSAADQEDQQDALPVDPPASAEQAESNSESSSSSDPQSAAEESDEAVANPAAEFVADGLDEKTAKALVDNNVTKSQLLGLINEGFDLTELEGIGAQRAEKILAIYNK